MSAPALEIHGLTVRHGSLRAVDGAELILPDHRLAALVGPSGCGKTSLLRAVAGFEFPVEGTVRVGGRTLVGPSVFVPPEHRRVGLVAQDAALFPHLTVGENVRYGVAGRAGADERVGWALELIGLGAMADRYPDQLSGGQRSRVAVARALAPSPQLILLDEPFAALDLTLRQRLRAEVRAILDQAGTAALLVTHDQEEALSVADTVAVMSAGKILQVGSPQDVYGAPATQEVAALLGEGRLIECKVAGGRLRTAFGTAGCDGADGPGRVFLRPEDLELEIAPNSVGAVGTLIERRFFGHDVLDSVRLDDGGILEVRVLSTDTAPIGSRVRLGLRDRCYRVFPGVATAAEPITRGVFAP